jgi:hypothetical protein
MELEKEILSDLVIWAKYSRYAPELNRRETWPELVTRNKEMHLRKFPKMRPMIEKAYELVYDKKILPSMRSLQFGGKPIEVNNTRLFNCCFLSVDDYRAFSETMFLLLCGTGVGYSVQSFNIEKLPAIAKGTKTRRYLIGDSIEGWADSIKVLMKGYLGLSATVPTFDFRAIRQKGERLITSGGVAPGPEPLKICLMHIQSVLDRKQDGDRLTSVECHDIMCFIADAVLSGGIRRSAMISLFDLDDEDMLTCKFGNWWELNPQRARANNSAILKRDSVSKEEFLGLWKKIELSNSGEPGFYFTNKEEMGTNPCCFAGYESLLTSDGYYMFEELCGKDFVVIDSNGERKKGKVWKTGAKNIITLYLSNATTINCTPEHVFLSEGESVKAEDLLGRKLTSFEQGSEPTVINIDFNEDLEPKDVYDFNIDGDNHWGVVNGVIAHNCEIALNPFQMCNLVEVNASDIKDQDDLNDRVYWASVIGTLQASYTDFHYLRPIWKETTEREALLGIGMTGIASGPVMKMNLQQAVNQAIYANDSVSSLIGINPAARITCVKPSGTSSLVLGTSSGIHAWHDEYYVRRMRIGKNEAMYTYLSIYHPEMLEDDVFKPQQQAVVSVPQSAPVGAITRNDENAIQFLERVKYFHEYWITPGHVRGDNTHNVSATVSMGQSEWPAVGEWLWENKSHFNGLSFLPKDLGTYVQTPFETITKEEYEQLVTNCHALDVAKIVEVSDKTNLMDQQACGGGNCEIS